MCTGCGGSFCFMARSIRPIWASPKWRLSLRILRWIATWRPLRTTSRCRPFSILYRDVLETELPWLDDVVRAKKPARMPVVLERDEIRMIMARLPAPQDLVIKLLYGSALRVDTFLPRRIPQTSIWATSMAGGFANPAHISAIVLPVVGCTRSGARSASGLSTCANFAISGRGSSRPGRRTRRSS